MMATIRSGARLFKAAVEQILETKQTITKTVEKICTKGQKLAHRFKKALRSFLSLFRTKKKKKSDPILIHLRPKPEDKTKNKLLKKKSNAKKSKPKKMQVKVEDHPKRQILTTAPSQEKEQSLANKQIKEVQAPKPTPITADTIKNFYQEWEANWGPALTGLDKEFLESASPEVVSKVIENGRLTLKSPYLKAVYNGLKDLQDISDLLENDELAKQKVQPFFKDYWDRKPEKFSEVLFTMHDKGYFPTRFGEKRLSLDPRLVPEWLGLVG